MDTVVLKFGGSSLTDNAKLNIVANRIIEFYKRKNKIVVVVSAQGKTTDKLIKEANELSSIPNEREMDVLLSSGEQMSMSKLAILLSDLGYETVSLTGWQAGIHTNDTAQEARILSVNTDRIEKELKSNRIVIVAGFQGINDKNDISTLGRGGSDTTAVAIAAAINADHCYIFSDVDGVYSADPNKILDAKKIQELSYVEMVNLSDEGAKVLHNRCVEIAEKYNVLIETKSTFNENTGTIINEKIEESIVKSIVKNDNLVLVNLKGTLQELKDISLTLLNNGITLNTIIDNSAEKLDISFTIHLNDLNRLKFLLEKKWNTLTAVITEISRISLIGYGIKDNRDVLEKTLEIFKKFDINILSVQIDETKLSIITKKKENDILIKELHKDIILQCN